MKARIKPPEFKSLGTAKYSRILQVLNSAKKGLDEEEDFDVPVEFLMTGCYPDLWNNFKANISEQFNAGYQQGLIDASNFTTSGYINTDANEECVACTVTTNVEGDKNGTTVNS